MDLFEEVITNNELRKFFIEIQQNQNELEQFINDLILNFKVEIWSL